LKWRTDSTSANSITCDQTGSGECGNKSESYA
jgi:hypothetical protein